jgi:hypothetical protein
MHTFKEIKNMGDVRARAQLGAFLLYVQEFSKSVSTKYTRILRTYIESVQDPSIKAQAKVILDKVDDGLPGMSENFSRNWVTLSDNILQLSPLIPESGIPHKEVFAIVYLCNAKFLFGVIGLIKGRLIRYNLMLLHSLQLIIM